MPDVLTAVLLIVVGAVLGCAAGWAIAAARVRGRLGADAAVLRSTSDSLQAQLGIRDQELAAARAAAASIESSRKRRRVCLVMESAPHRYAVQPEWTSQIPIPV